MWLHHVEYRKDRDIENIMDLIIEVWFVHTWIIFLSPIYQFFYVSAPLFEEGFRPPWKLVDYIEVIDILKWMDRTVFLWALDFMVGTNNNKQSYPIIGDIIILHSPMKDVFN